MFLMLIGFQMLTAFPYVWVSSIPEVPTSGAFFLIALVFSALYTMTSAGLLFCNEHEEKTYSLIRSLPVSRKSLLAGKLGWLLAGSTAFLVLGLLVTLPWVVMCESFGVADNRYNAFSASFTDSAWQGLWVPVGCLLYPMCWGLLFSTRLQNQMQAALATIFFSLFTFWCTIVPLQSLIMEMDRTDVPDWPWLLAMGLSCIGITLLAGGFGVYSGSRWFDIWIDKGSRFAGDEPSISQTARSRAAEYERLATARFHKRGEFFALYRHVFRQSLTFFQSVIWINVVCIVLIAICNNRGIQSARDSFPQSLNTILEVVVGVSYCSLFVVAVAFCGSVFSADQRTRAAFLADRGIAPGKIWWSRFLAFLTVWTGCIIFDFFLFSFSFSGKALDALAEHPEGMPMVFGFLTIPLLIGTLVSMLFRSRIVSILVTAALTWGFMIWLTLVGVYFQDGSNMHGGLFDFIAKQYHWLWYAAPILLGWLVASRLRCDDWLRGRSLWRSRRPVVCCIVLPFVVICCVIPFYRIYSVRLVDYGYRAAPEALRPGFDSSPGSIEIRGFLWEQCGFNDDLIDFKELRSHIRDIEDSFTDPSEADLASCYWNMESHVRQGLEWRLRLIDLAKEELEVQAQREGTYQLKYHSRVTVDLDRVDPKLLDQGIAILESLEEDHVPFSERFKRVYEVDYRRIKFGQIPYPLDRYVRKEPDIAMFLRKSLFWERIRMLRLLDNAFQINCLFADRMEKAVFHGKGDLPYLMNQAIDELIGQSHLWNNIFLTSPMTFDTPHAYYRLYHSELKTRFTILRFALLKYRIQYGVLPETLEELKTVGYLKEIPKVPYYDQPFYYDPHPDGSEPDYDKSTQHRRGIPYLWAPGIVGRNEVQPKPFREETDAGGSIRRVWLKDDNGKNEKLGEYFDLGMWSKKEQKGTPPSPIL